MSDPGHHDDARSLPRHAYPPRSVQANAVNWATVKFWHQMGLNAILSRELSRRDEEIRMQVPEMNCSRPRGVHGLPGRCLPPLHQQA